MFEFSLMEKQIGEKTAPGTFEKPVHHAFVAKIMQGPPPVHEEVVHGDSSLATARRLLSTEISPQTDLDVQACSVHMCVRVDQHYLLPWLMWVWVTYQEGSPSPL